MKTNSQPTKISKARASLVIGQPFFATILLGQPMVLDESIPTMATDGESIRYNPEFVEKLSHDELVFVLAHEVLHTVFLHSTRREGRNPNRWNIAADYVINEILVRDKIGRMPAGGLHDPQLVQNGDGTAEGVYKLLPKESENQGPGQPGGALDQVLDAGQNQKQQNQPGQQPGQQPGGVQLTDAERNQKEAELKAKIVQARDIAKAYGKLPGGLKRILDELTAPVVDWKTVLKTFMTQRAKVDVSFAKPKRRFLANDLILPSPTGEKIGRLVVAVDCSGSINRELLNEFAAEIRGIFEDTKPDELEVVYFDSKVLDKEVFREGDEIHLEPLGGGGTAFSPIFAALEENPPVGCVVLTDLESDDFGPCPDFPVLWASTGSENAPFGEVVKIKLK